MNKYWVIFENTLAKEWRNKFLIFLFALTVGLIILINFVMDWVGQIPGVFLDATLANKKLYTFYYIINTWNVFLSIIMGVSCVRSDLNDGVYAQILSFPVKRMEYLLSRILGSTAIVLGYYLLSILLALTVFAFSSEGKVFIDPGIFLALLPNILLIFSTLTLTVLISLFATKIATFISTFILVAMISSSNANFAGVPVDYMFSELSFIKIMGIILYFLFPRIGTLNTMATDIVMGKTLGVSIGWEILHLGLTLGILYVLVLLILRRREV